MRSLPLFLPLLACNDDPDEPVDACPNAALRVPDDAASVQEALDLAADGDIVGVDPGTWGPATITRPVSLVSTGGSAVTALDAGGVGSVVSVSAGEVTLAVFTLANGVNAEGYGHGVRVAEVSGVLLSDLVIADPPSAGSGGGVHVLGASDITLRGVRVSGATAPGGAGVYAEDTAGLLLEGCAFEENHAGGGGAVALCGVTGARVVDRTFTGNSVAETGQGGALWVSGGDATIEGCTFDGNLAPEAEGAAVWAGEAATLTVTGTTFTDHATPWADGLVWGTGFGDGIYAGTGVTPAVAGSSFAGCPNGGCVAAIEQASASVEDSTFIEDEFGLVCDSGGPVSLARNTWTQRGVMHVVVTNSASLTITGDVHAGGAGDATAVVADLHGDVRVEDRSFTDLWVPETRWSVTGAGLAVYSPGSITVTGSEFARNESVDTGTVMLVAYGDTQAITVEDCTFVDNVAREGGLYAGYGGGLFVRGGGPVTLTGLTVTGNGAEWAGGGLFVHGATSLELVDSYVADNTAWYEAGGVYAFDCGTSTWDPSVEITGNLADEDEGGGVLCEACGGNPATADVHDNLPDNIECVSEPRWSTT